MTLAISIASGTAELLHARLRFDSVSALAVIVAVVILLYVGATRGIMGGTAGERLTSVRYSSA
jgi:hypothetical protein